jgi:NAD(P)-dependent dehydrogenase (short-subunit alcohol dehydrogenase family)
MSDFASQTIFITGGASGIGLEAARQLAARGAAIAVFDLRLPGDAISAIEAARLSPPKRVARYALDVSDRRSVLETFTRAAAELGPPDVLIHSAGVAKGGEFLSMAFEDFDRTLQVNVYGTRHVCEATAPLMVQRGRGQIVLIASMAGILPAYGYTDYATSKFAVRGFAECLRYELKPHGVSVLCFCPGEVDTPMVAAERKTIHPATLALKRTGGTISVDVAVRDLLNGMRRNQPLIITGARSRLLRLAERLLPRRLWNWYTDRIVAQALLEVA